MIETQEIKGSKMIEAVVVMVGWGDERTMGKNTRRRVRIEIYRDEETEVDRTIGESVFKIWRERDQDVKIR